MIKIVVEDYSDCPYYTQIGSKQCDSGCHDEPVCVTNEPIDGWPETVDFETRYDAIQYLGEEALYDRENYGGVIYTEGE